MKPVSLARSDEAHLRLLIDLRWMIPGTAGGLETVAWCFLERLFAVEPFADVTLIVPSELMRRLRNIAPAWIKLVSRDNLQADIGAVFRKIGLSDAAQADQAKFDLVYTLNGRIHPDLSGIPAVVLMADLQHLALPELFDPSEQRIRAQASLDAARTAQMLLTISHFSQGEIADRLDFPKNRIVVAHLAADAVFQQTPDAHMVTTTLARHGLKPGSYLFLPARLWPHKNHAAVVAALELIAADGQTPPDLVCVGGANAEDAARLKSEIARSSVARHVRYLGRVPRDDLPAFYAGASALIFCSRYEGFGMPVVEAMAIGCPVIAGNSTSLPEVAGEAALLVDAEDTTSIANAIRKLANDPHLRAQKIAQGHMQAAAFSWQRHSDTVLATLFAASGRSLPTLRPCSGALPSSSAPLVLPPAGDVASSGVPAWFDEVIYPRFRRLIVFWLRRFGFFEF